MDGRPSGGHIFIIAQHRVAPTAVVSPALSFEHVYRVQHEQQQYRALNVTRGYANTNAFDVQTRVLHSYGVVIKSEEKIAKKQITRFPPYAFSVEFASNNYVSESFENDNICF